MAHVLAALSWAKMGKKKRLVDGPVLGWLVCFVYTVNTCTSQPRLRFPNICVCYEGEREDKVLNCKWMPADGHLLCCEKLWLSKFGCIDQTQSQPVRKALEKQNSVGQREQQEQRQIRAGQQCAFTLSINQATYNSRARGGA